jgi:hypothetical protein
MAKVGWLVVWFLETLSEALLFSILLMVLEWHDLKDPWTPAYQVVAGGLVMVVPILLYLFLTGYMLTTAVFRVAWKGQTLWSYPAVATLLFFLHFEILSLGVGGAFDPRVRLEFRVGGACIVFACTFAGGYLLRWKSMRRRYES